MSEMNIQEILKFLPHRYPFLLVDRVISIDADQSIIAIKNVTMNEQFFTGHFPDKAVMPGVLIIEALAQTAGILAYKSMKVLCWMIKTVHVNTAINNICAAQHRCVLCLLIYQKQLPIPYKLPNAVIYN